MKPSKLARTLAILALFAAPLTFGVIANAGIGGHGRLFDDHSRRELSALEARLVDRGMTADQARAIADYEAGQSSRVASFIVGVGGGCVSMMMFLGVTLAAFIAGSAAQLARVSAPR
jgi:hypothetical protein